MRIKDARSSRVTAGARPHYRPAERIAILAVKAARTWSLAQAALAFQLLRVDSLVKKPVEPKTPPPNQPNETDSKSVKSGKTVKAKHPGYTWHIDLTTVPTRQGFWVPWLPFALRQTWPFAYCVFSIVDHFSRKCILSKAFRKAPTTKAVTDTLDLAIALCGKAPKYIISDQGTQFRENYELWCDSHRIKPRFGALGQHGSIAVIERFNRTLKDELIRKVLVPLRLSDFNEELIRYVIWYNEHRPHQWLQGKTPNEVYDSRFPARDGPRFEPRPKYPLKARDGNQASTLAQRATNLQVVVTHLDDRQHLPIISIKQAA